MSQHKFISKSLYFPEKGILVIGDLHIGYDYHLQQSGIIHEEIQIRELIKELEEILLEVKSKPNKLKKIIFLGDIKHSFAYHWREKNYFQELLDFVRTNFEEKNIIFIKGNHDTVDLTFNNKILDYYIEDDVAFVHGDKFFIEVFDKNIKTIVMGHIHPSVMLSERTGVKRERYKCFLTGKFKGKEIIVLPSFLSTTEGQTLDDYREGFSIIPKRSLMKFKVHIVGEDRVYEFGSAGDLLK